MTTQTPQSEPSSIDTPSQKVVGTVTMYWKDLREHLPMPGRAWRWGEIDVPFQCLYRLNEHNMLKQSDVGRKHWETTEQLWLYVISRATDDETVGSRKGQKVLQAHPEPNQSDTWRQENRPSTGKQTDFTGNLVGELDEETDSPEQRMARNASKDPTWKTCEIEADPKQLTLFEVCALSRAGDVSTQQVGSFVRPVGQVYHSATLPSLQSSNTPSF